jgi:hypothetical protein
VLDALGAVERICDTGRTVVTGACAGGIIASVMAAHLAAAGQQDRLACFALLVTVLDTANAGTVAALADRPLAAAAPPSIYPGRCRFLHRRRDRRPYHPVAELLSQHPAARRPKPVHPVH